MVTGDRKRLAGRGGGGVNVTATARMRGSEGDQQFEEAFRCGSSAAVLYWCTAQRILGMFSEC